jgi:ArsR family transcriptional regulator
MNTDLATRSRRQVFSADDCELAGWAKALGHPARLAIVRFLAGRTSCYCGQIVTELPLAQSTVSQHLRELKDAGIIQGTVAGKRVCYCLDPATLARLRAAFGGLFELLAQADVCDETCQPPTD